ncbi:MAG: diheme cytochrome c [Burkholderiales bacterium]|nr:diheme cytochrome c [Burkholderiales bacterium]
MSPTFRAAAWTLAALFAAGAAAVARADSPVARAPANPRYQQECASCHVAYPPALLPAAAWTRVMHGLQHHYGTDASLEPQAVRELGAWLAANAGDGRRVRTAPPADRITRAEWFVREHRKVAASVWTRPAVGSASNCAACHQQADKGDFDEHAVRIPR